MPSSKPPKYRSEVHRRQAKKNWMMLCFLLGLVGLFFVTAIVRMGGA